MKSSTRARRLATAVVVCGLIGGFLAGASAAPVVLDKVVDRKFPTGTFCPLESRGSAVSDLTFTPPGSAVRITLAVRNVMGFCNQNGAPCVTAADCGAGDVCGKLCSSSFGECAVDADCPPGEVCGQWNKAALDNVTVVPKTVFDAHLAAPDEDNPYFSCYIDSVPPGQTSAGTPGAPAYDFNAAGTPEAYLERFDAAGSTTSWSGQVYFDAARRAPRAPVGPAFDETGGSLGLGRLIDGTATASARINVGGLTPGVPHVVHGWWSVDVAEKLRIIVEDLTNACVDGDGDGFVACSGCAPLLGQTCGECEDANPRCGSSCHDVDGDGWCPPADCNDYFDTCQTNCGADGDGDGIDDCRDLCLDADGDGYGVPGEFGNDCLGSDCWDANPGCNVSCVDADADGSCSPGDCAPSDPARYQNAPEVNDCTDQQCPGDLGYGVPDETSGLSGYSTPGDKNTFSWPPQSGASRYQAARSTQASFASCTVVSTTNTFWTDATQPVPGQVLYYLNRPILPCAGSWGQRSSLVERTPACATETNCTDGLDDDGDFTTDCADRDCAAHAACQVATFTFLDTTGNDIADTAFRDFLLATPATASHYMFFELDEYPGRKVAWCATNAKFYRDNYIALAAGAGTAMSGSWNKWRRTPSTANAWAGPVTTALVNDYGDNCFGTYSWCSEQFAGEPQNSIFPDRINDCEAYDLATGACGASIGGTWRLTIRIGADRLAACGF